MDFLAARARLIQSLSHEISNARVLGAMRRVPREDFVPEDSRNLAYEDMPLPIGQGQTISQPFIVALMTQALELQGGEKVLEVGTGSGYQTALLAELTRWVVSVERFEALAQNAREVLARLGYSNVEIHVATRNLGWRPEAPYDAVLVTAGAPRIPQSLLDQMSHRATMVIPIGSRYEQDLLQVKKRDSRLETLNLGACRFVPLIGEEAWSEEE